MAETLTQVRARRLEANSKLLELAGEDDLTDEQEAEFSKLTGDVAKLTRREQAMVAAGADEPPDVVAEGSGDDSDAAEFAKLVDDASLGDVLDVALFGKRPAGATAELQAEVGLGENVIPLELFAASTVTSAGDVERQEPTVEQVFASPISMGLGIDRRSVGVGVTNVPVVTAPTSGPDGTTAIGTSVADSAVTIAGVQLSPTRLQISATIGRDELSTFRGLETEVERVLRAAIMSALDGQALYSGTADGLLNHGTAPSDTTDVVTYASLLAAVYGALDGRYASGLKDLATLLGPATAQLAAALYRGTTADNETAYDALMARTGGVMTSDLVAAASSDNQQAVTFRGTEAMPGYAQRLWGGAEVIRDPYTKAADGQIVCTVVLMQASKILRAGQYVRHSFHLA